MHAGRMEHDERTLFTRNNAVKHKTQQYVYTHLLDSFHCKRGINKRNEGMDTAQDPKMLLSPSSSAVARSFRSRDQIIDRRNRNRMLEEQQQQQQTSSGSTSNAMLDAMNNSSSSTLNSTTFAPVPPSFSNNSTASPTPQLGNNTNRGNDNDPSAMATTTEEFVLSRVFFALAFFAITILYICVKIVRKSHFGDEDENGVDTVRRHGRQNHAEQHQQQQQQHPKMKLSPEKRLELYNDTFEMNGHQIVLEPHHILVEPSQSKFASEPSSPSKQEEEKEEASSHDLENDKITRLSTTRRSSSSSQIQKKQTRKSSLKLSRRSSGMLSSVMSILNYNNDGDDFGDDDDGPSAYLVLDEVRPDGRKIASEKKQESQNQRQSQQQDLKKSGICSICLEQMGVGQTIVYSDHEDCQHVFHKHCLVPAFAYSKGPKNLRLRSSHAAIMCPNPCPNCRRNFCTTILDHQVALTYGVEIQTTSSTTHSDHHSQLESENDDSQQSSSTAGTSSNDSISTDENDGNTADDNDFHDVELG